MLLFNAMLGSVSLLALWLLKFLHSDFSRSNAP